MDVLDDNPGRHGNFQALLQFRVQAGDEVLKEHLKTAGGRATYTSKESQNELLAVCGDLVRRKLVRKVQAAHFYSVIADEATDASNQEQLSISVRFFHQEMLSERFLGFHLCDEGVTGEALAKSILEKLVEWQLDPQLLRGQAYDGGGAMAGKSKGVAAQIIRQYPKALYTHCAAHRLNLCC